MVVKIQKWGNSQGLRLAKHVLEESGMAIGDDVEIVVGENEIIIRKKAGRKFVCRNQGLPRPYSRAD